MIGNDTAVTVAGTQGNFELNVRVPMMARNVFDSIRLLTAASRLLAEKCVDGLEPNEESLRRHAESTPAIATALNPFIGYDLGTEIVNEAVGLVAHDPRGGDREGRGRGDARQGPRPARDGTRGEAEQVAPTGHCRRFRRIVRPFARHRPVGAARARG